MSERNGVVEIQKVCEAALGLRESDFEAAREIIRRQENIDRLSPGDGVKIRPGLMSEHNARVLRRIEDLRETLILGIG